MPPERTSGSPARRGADLLADHPRRPRRHASCATPAASPAACRPRRRTFRDAVPFAMSTGPPRPDPPASDRDDRHTDPDAGDPDLLLIAMMAARSPTLAATTWRSSPSDRGARPVARDRDLACGVGGSSDTLTPGPAGVRPSDARRVAVDPGAGVEGLPRHEIRTPYSPTSADMISRGGGQLAPRRNRSHAGPDEAGGRADVTYT
jgi:hypothetical protein